MPRSICRQSSTISSSLIVDQLADIFPDVDSIRSRLDAVGYVVDSGLATVLFCAVRLGQPLLLEGEPGVGKTEAAKALATAMDTLFVRLQCYEGIDASEAVYEWNYPKQLLGIRLSESGGQEISEADLFSESYLIERPLLKVIRHQGPRPAVLLIDEIDRSDDEFEAFLLELLGEASLTVPELGTYPAVVRPVVILTSNRTRDLHDALKRRCLYHWIEFPSLEGSIEILRRRVPESKVSLLTQVARAVREIRGIDGIQKAPGIAEAINWANALQLLGADTLNKDVLTQTLGSLLKYREDQDVVREMSGAVVSNDTAD